jgi:hypothetical protein
MNPHNLLAELKRRNVIRMAGLYLVGAWLVVQVAGTVLPMFGAPEWLPCTIVCFAGDRVRSRGDLEVGFRINAAGPEAR